MKRHYLTLALLLLFGCSQTTFPKFSSMVNNGILPLSTTNAYVGSNLFIADEAQRSRQLFNFLAGRGAPTAIELNEEFNKPPHLVMFYPKDKEVYAAELMDLETQNGMRFREWVIRGPYAIERKDYRELVRLEASFVGEPLFMINGREKRFRFVEPESSNDTVRTVLVPVLPTPAPTPTPKRKPAKIITDKGSEKPKVDEHKPTNTDQEALRIAQGFAERAENGDLFHTVTAEKETINTIAKWYSGTDIGAVAIAATNQIQPNTPLEPGVRIRIPKNVIKTDKQMPTGFK